MQSLLDFVAESDKMDFSIEIAALIMKMLKSTDNLSRPVRLDVGIRDTTLSPQRVMGQIMGAGGRRVGHLLRLAGSKFSMYSHIKGDGGLVVTISDPCDDDESKVVQFQLDSRK